MMHATRNPDGSFEYESILYRLEQGEDDSFEVVRDNDHASVGRFQVKPGPRVSVLPGAVLPEVVDAISRLVAGPLGVLPLQ